MIITRSIIIKNSDIYHNHHNHNYNHNVYVVNNPKTDRTAFPEASSMIVISYVKVSNGSTTMTWAEGQCGAPGRSGR